MKLFEKTKKEEIEEQDEELDTENPSEEKEPKKLTIPKPIKYAAAGIGIIVGAIGLSKLFGNGGEVEDYDFDEAPGESDSSETETTVEAENTSGETAE